MALFLEVGELIEVSQFAKNAVGLWYGQDFVIIVIVIYNYTMSQALRIEGLTVALTTTRQRQMR